MRVGGFLLRHCGLQAAVFVAALALFDHAHADDLRLTQIQAPQNERVEANAYPWTAVAKLNNGIGGSCTAVLIAPGYALTAAHCLYYRITGKFLPAESFHLIFGYENQNFRQHVRIAAYHIASDYDPSRPYESLAHDWALLSIAAPDKVSSKPLHLEQSAKIKLNSNLMTAGYSHIVPFVMTADRGCKIIGRSFDRRFLLDTCKAPAGYSGGPVLVVDSGNPGKVDLIGIHVASQTSQRDMATVAVSTESIWPEIKSCVQGKRCDFSAVAKGRDPSASEILSLSRTKTIPTEYLCDPDNKNCVTSLTGP